LSKFTDLEKSNKPIERERVGENVAESPPFAMLFLAAVCGLIVGLLEIAELRGY
jgi:hypothetical protein